MRRAPTAATVDLRVVHRRAGPRTPTRRTSWTRSAADAFFVAFSPASRLAFGYVWSASDFPWLGIWEENLSRPHAPWTATSITRGMEFGVSPMPEPRRQMIDRGTLFGVPTYRLDSGQAPGRGEYWAIAQDARAVPETLERPL